MRARVCVPSLCDKSDASFLWVVSPNVLRIQFCVHRKIFKNYQPFFSKIRHPILYTPTRTRVHVVEVSDLPSVRDALRIYPGCLIYRHRTPLSDNAVSPLLEAVGAYNPAPAAYWAGIHLSCCQPRPRKILPGSRVVSG